MLHNHPAKLKSQPIRPQAYGGKKLTLHISNVHTHNCSILSKTLHWKLDSQHKPFWIKQLETKLQPNLAQISSTALTHMS